MTPATLKWMILQELNHRELNPTTGHFRMKEEIHERLLEPFKAEFMMYGGSSEEFWIVFNEMPDDPKGGYLIVYSEEEELFGLATKNSIEELGYLVGLYGSFVDTLNNMKYPRKARYARCVKALNVLPEGGFKRIVRRSLTPDE